MENQLSSLKSLQIVHTAMFAGQVLFAVIASYLVFSGVQEAHMQGNTEKILQVVAIVFSAGGFFAGTTLFKKKLMEIRSMTGTVQEKFAVYRSASITQWALLEGPALFCIICFFLTGNYAFVILAFVLIILFFLLAPKRIKIAFQLGLSQREADEL